VHSGPGLDLSLGPDPSPNLISGRSLGPDLSPGLKPGPDSRHCCCPCES